MLYYPDLVSISVNKARVPFEQDGRFIEVNVPPGQHGIIVDFVGVRWANWLSACGWAAVIIVIVIVAGGRLRHSRAEFAHVLQRYPLRPVDHETRGAKI